MKVCVYCASSAKADPKYGQGARDLGVSLASAGATVVFGGGGTGSMGKLADGVLAAGGKLLGIMPTFMRELEWNHPGVTDFVWTETMAERKAKLVEGADAVVALPGGSGTFEELVEVITMKRLGQFLKPVVIVNQDGYYDSLLELFRMSVKERFMNERHLDIYTVVDGVEDVVRAIRETPEWPADARSFAAVQ